MKHDVIHFEALGPEALHLEQEALGAKQRCELPVNFRQLATPLTVQDFLAADPEISLPDLITIKTHSILPESFLSGSKKSVVTRSAGYDHVEHLAARANITWLQAYCVAAVAQTGMKMIYCAAGNLNAYTALTPVFDRQACQAFLELGPHVTLSVFGVGKIGKAVHDLAKANGLTVLGVDLRQDTLDSTYHGAVCFVSQAEAMRRSHIIVNAMNLTTRRQSPYYNVGYFSREAFDLSPHRLIFINLTRGEIAPESTLLGLHRSGKLAGIGLDVFSKEADFADLMQSGGVASSPDLCAARTLVKLAAERRANIYVQPHQAFNSDLAARAKAAETFAHLVAWYRNAGRFNRQMPCG